MPRSVSCCSPGELLDEPDADAPALIVVRHHKRRLGNERVPQSNVVRDRNHPFVADFPDNCDERASFVPIGSDKAAHEAIAAPTETVEAEVAASLREPVEEPCQGRLVVRRRRTEAERRPVAEDDVDGDAGRDEIGHQPKHLASTRSAHRGMARNISG